MKFGITVAEMYYNSLGLCGRDRDGTVGSGSFYIVR